MKNNIRVLRKQLEFRQEDVATKLGVTRQTINAIENAKYNPTLELAMNIAKLLKTTVEKLFILEIHKVN
jgi:putative transcriptional regulator